MLLIANNSNRRSDIEHSMRTMLRNPARAYGDVDETALPFYYKFHRIASSILVPPVPVLNGVFADEWQLELSLSYGAASISASTAMTITSTIGDRAGADIFTQASYFNSASSGDDDISVSINVGGHQNIRYGYTLGEWSLPLSIAVNASGDTPSSIYGCGQLFFSPGSSYSGITVTCAGESVTLYDGGNQDAAATGTITLTPTSWLPLE